MNSLLDRPDVVVTPLAITPAASGPHSYQVLRLLRERCGCLLEDSDELIVNDQNPDLQNVAIDAIPAVVTGGELLSTKLFSSFKYPTIKDGSHFDAPLELQKPFTYGGYTAVLNDQPDKFEFIYSVGTIEHDIMSLEDLPEG
jgi:hypothetical protein